jgi:hypothetical protein
VISTKTKVDTLITAADDCVKVDVRMTDGRVNSIEVGAYTPTKWSTIGRRAGAGETCQRHR